MSWFRRNGRAAAAVIVSVGLAILVLLGGIVALQNSASPVATVLNPVDPPTIVPADTLVPAPTAVPPVDTPTPIPQAAPPIGTTNNGDASYAVLGANFSDWTAKYGQPMSNSGQGQGEFGPCPSDSSFPMYTVQYPDTGLIISIQGGDCPGASTSEADMLSAAMAAFPPDASAMLGSCTDEVGDVYRFYTSPTFAASAWYQTYGWSAADCAGNALPAGSFTWEANMGNHGRFVDWGLSFTGGG